MSGTASVSKTGLRVRRAAAALALISALGLAPRGAFAGQAAGQAVVDRIVVEVDGRPGAEGLFDLIPFKPGDLFQPSLIDLAVKQIFRTGLFADVRVERTGDERIELTFILVRKVFIDDILFRGTKAPATRLRDAVVSLRPGGTLEEDRFPAAVEEVREGLRREGYFDAVVESEVRKKPGASTADIVFRAMDWKSFRVGGLEVEWKAEIPERKLLKALKTKIGDPYVPRRVADDLDALAAGLAKAGYSRAEVRLAGESFDDQRRKVDLRVEILPEEKIVIVVNGASVPRRLLEPIWAERVFEPWGLSEADARILNHLRRKGFLFAEVKSRFEKGPDELRIIHDVRPGDKHDLTGVVFHGLTAFSDAEMKNRLAIREGVPFFSLLSYDRLFTLPRDIEGYYRERGYADIQVQLELARQAEGVEAVLNIQEGPKTLVDVIRFEGVEQIDAETLLARLVSRQGGPFFPPNVQRDVSQIEVAYLDRGIRGASIVPRIEPSGENRVSLVYEVEEGEPITVRNIYFTGNRITKNRIIRRELRIGKGDVADYSKIQASKRGLERLGIFSDVGIEEVQTGPAEEVVVVTVREGDANYTGFGLGFESLTPLTGSLASWPTDFRPRVAAEYIRTNIFGLGAQAGILGQLSSRERRIVLSWNQPYLFSLPMPTTLLAWAEREDRESFTYDREGVSLSAIKPLTKARLLLGSLSLTRTAIPEYDIENLPEDIDRRFLPYSAAVASVSMNWERRDDTLNPNRGYFFSAVAEWGFPIFGMESDYQKTFLKGQYFRPLASTLNLGTTARLGLGNGLHNLPERFFAGGSNTFRGEEFEMLGPLDPVTLEPYGGEAVLLVNTELSWAVFPSWKAFRVVSFFDLGNVYESLSDFRPFDLLGAIGAGLRYKTPLGPVRVEIAWKLWGFDAQDARGQPLIFLTIGNIF